MGWLARAPGRRREQDKQLLPASLRGPGLRATHSPACSCQGWLPAAPRAAGTPRPLSRRPLFPTAWHGSLHQWACLDAQRPATGKPGPVASHGQPRGPHWGLSRVLGAPLRACVGSRGGTRPLRLPLARVGLGLSGLDLELLPLPTAHCPPDSRARWDLRAGERAGVRAVTGHFRRWVALGAHPAHASPLSFGACRLCG